MGGSDTPPAQRARTKAPDFSELFRSTHGSRHTSRTGAGTGSSPFSTTPSSGEKPAGTKASSRRSMLPFLGRKKPEQSAVSAAPLSRKSVGNAVAYSVTPVNTVRRSFGNGSLNGIIVDLFPRHGTIAHAVLMITPSMSSPSAEPPLPSKLPTTDAHTPSLGSKLAAHFTPLRSPSRNSKTHCLQKSAPPSPVPSPTTLLPPVPQIRAPSIESQHSSMRSRSTTPRPLRGPHLSAAENGDEEDFSDLFTLPEKLKKPQPSPKSPSTTSVYVYLGDSPRKSGELTPTTPVTPLGPSLQFPIPPSTIIPPRLTLTEKGIPRYSSELASLSSQGSRSPSTRPSPVVLDSGSTRSLYSDLSSQDERQDMHHRTISNSGSDTDTSRAGGSTYSVSSFKLAPVVPKRSSMKSKLPASSVTKASSGPPPSVPLPSPPLSPNSSGLGPRSAPIPSPNRVVFPRPRANTLSVTSNLTVPGYTIPKPSLTSPPRTSRANSDVTPDATTDELREALSQQHRKNTQLQEYIVTITKRYEADRTAMTRTIEKLERNVRKKTREIEGLRWLVIHNGAVSDIDAAANLARSSFSTQDGDNAREFSSLASSQVSPHNGSSFHQSIPRRQGVNTTVTTAASIPEVRSGMSSSAASFSTTSASESASLPSTSGTPERVVGISRAERQKLKEERRASKALRRISAVSTLAMGADSLSQPPSGDSPVDLNFDPKQSMDEVFEKLQPFRHT